MWLSMEKWSDSGSILSNTSLRASTSHSIGVPMQGETRMAMGNRR